MQVGGSASRATNWTAFIPNGGFGVKRQPPLVGLGPSPTAVNFLQEELGHTLTPKTIDFAYINRTNTSPGFPAYPTGGQSRSEAGSSLEMKELMGLSSPMMECGEVEDPPAEERQERRAFRALANLFICPATTFPLSVGLFYNANSTNMQNSSLVQLEDDIGILLRVNTKALPTFSAALVLVPAITIFFAAYLLSITIKFEVGLSLGILGLFVQFFVLLAIAIGKQCFNLRIAWNASLILSSFVRQVNLFTKFFFYYPRRKFNSMSPVKLQTVNYRLSQSPNTPHLILMLLKLMWVAMERQYNPIVVRLQRFMHQSQYVLSNKRTYKRICCLPAFMVVIMLGIAILIDLLLLRIFEFNAIAMLTDMRVLPIFVIMSSIIFLGVCASIPSVVNAVFAYLYRPKTPLMKAIETYAKEKSELFGRQRKRSRLLDSLTSKIIANGNDLAKSNGVCLEHSLEAADMLPVTSSCEVDILAKKEFANICDMLHAFNFYLQDIEQTRLVILIDAKEATSAVQLAGVFYQLHSLLLTQPNAPIAFVIAANINAFYEQPLNPSRRDDMVFQESLTNETGEALSLLRSVADSNHLVLFSIQLPIFLDASTTVTDPSTLQRLPGADNLLSLLQSSATTTPNTSHLITSVPEGDRPEGQGRRARTKVCIGSTAGQINRAYTSAEELGLAAGDGAIEPSVSMKTAQSTTSLSGQGHLRQQSTSSTTAPEVVVSVNTSRVSATKAGAKGIAEIFLANEEMAEQNVPVIRTLVAETAFTSRLIKLSATNISIKQLVNWIYLTQHWPFHMAWLMVLLEEDPHDVSTAKGTLQTSVPSPMTGQTSALSGLIARTLEEVSALPPVSSILSADDRDPAKLLNFIQNKVECHYSLLDLRHLVDNSLFVNPVFRVCIREIRNYYYGAARTDDHGADVDHTRSNSEGVQSDGRPREKRREFYVTAPSPRSFDTLPHCLETEFTDRPRGTGGGGGGEGGQNNDSSGDTRSPLPVSIDSEPLEKGLCFANPFNFPIVSPCPIRLKCKIPMIELSKMNVDDVCMLLSAISDLPSSNCSAYQMRVRHQNINGQVLSVCDLTKLRTELQMSFGDWQLFHTFIMYLRGVEASLADRSRNSQTGSYTGDVKFSHGSLAVTSTYPYSQVLVSPSPFVLCNEQSQSRGKNMFDVPVLVQQVPIESNVGNTRQNTDRTTSDFSFGSGTDELELAWRRDAKPDSLNGNSRYQHGGKESTGHQATSLSNAVWIESTNRLSKSTHDLCSTSTSRRSQGRQASSRGGERHVDQNTRKVEKQVPLSVYHSASGAPDHVVQIVPAYISRTPDSSGIIPVWCPTLPCVGETNTSQQPPKPGEGYSSESSSVSKDGTYDFPSEYSSGECNSQQRHVYRRQCPSNCPHSYRERRQRRKSTRSSRSSNRPTPHTSSRGNSISRCSQKSAEGCTCEYFLYEKGQSGRSPAGVNPWTTRSPRKISSPDLSDIEAMTSS